MLHRRTFFIAAAGLVLSRPSFAQDSFLTLDQLSDYFNALTSAKARFLQLNDDGTRSTGTLYIRRPGRARFEYDPPQKALVMAGAGKVAIFDDRSNAGRPEQYPLKRTPLNLILEREVDLAARNMVVGHFYDDENTTLVAQDPDAPENGRIELVFRNAPAELLEWTIVDGGGSRTRVILSEMQTGINIPIRLFNIVLEQQARQR